MPTSPPSEPVDASGGGLPVPPDGVLPLDAIETIELVRGDVLPPPDWERPATVRPTRPQPSSSGSPIPRPPPQPVPVEARGRSAPIGRTPPTGPRPSGPIVAARPPWPTTSTGPSAPEPEALHVDVGLDDGGLGDVGLGDVGLGVATHVGAGPRPQGAPTTGGDRRGGTDSDGDSDRGHDARGAQRDGPGASTTVRLAPRRRLTAVLAVLAAVAVVGAVLLTIGRRPPATSSAYPWETLPAPVLAEPQRRWAVELAGDPPERVAASAARIFIARAHDADVTISALAASDGGTLWQADVDAPGSSVMQLVLSGDVLVAITGSNGVQAGVSAFDAATGSRRWQATIDASWVTVVDGTDPLMVLSGPSPRMASRVDALDLATGQPRWSRSGVVGDLAGGRLALVENDDVLTVDIADGHETARWPGVARGMVARTVVVSGTRVVVLSEDDLRLAGVGSSQLDGSLDPGIGQLFTTIRTGGDQVTVLSQDGMAGIDLRSGHIEWSRDVTPRALARTDGRTILLGWSDRSTGTMITIDAGNGREEGSRDIDGLVRRPRDRRASYIARADYLADGATYQVGGGGVEAYDLPGLDVLWTLDATELGATARDVTATDAGLLISTTTGGLLLYR